MDWNSLLKALPQSPVDVDYLAVAKTQGLSILHKIIMAALVFGVGWLLINNIKRVFLRIMARGRLDKALTNLIGSVLTFAGWVIVIAAIFKVLGFTEVSLAFSGSLALVAMGLASSASSVVGDLFSGVSLIADDDFQIGCRVTAAGVTGEVISIDMRKTKIIDDKGNLYIIPNKALDNSTLAILAPLEAHKEDKGA